MKQVSRNLVATLIAASLSMAFAGPGLAADTAPKAAPARGAGPAHHAMHEPKARDPVAHAQQRLDTLGKKLNLKAAQQEAWKSFSASMLKLAQEHAQEMEKQSPAERAKFSELSAPDKLEAIAAKMRKGADGLSKLASDTRPFYDQLSPEQKTIFDLFAKDGWHERMRQRMHHPMR